MHPSHAHPTADSWHRPARPTRPFAALWHDLLGAWRRALVRARAEPISDATLRDLGISRSELWSFDAETRGLVEVTRRRVIDARDARP